MLFGEQLSGCHEGNLIALRDRVERGFCRH
jgi:hypothetical protein